MRKLATLVAGSCLALLGGAATQAQAADPFGHACVAQNGVRHCATRTLQDRVPSWDGIPIDVDVTLPATGSGPFPTIVMMHGLGGDKAMFQDTRADGSSALTYHYNNVYYAQKGYAVVSPTARGFGNSCGAASRTSAGCASGWARLDDTRYEARDVQHLLGLLVDQGVADPARLGATGVSYGGGTSAELAFLRDRIRLPNGSFAAWRSPAGTPLSLAAAYPRWGWAELGTALIPNGRANDGQAPTARLVSDPPGVARLSYTTMLYAISGLVGTVSAPGADPEADLTTWYGRLLQGEPYTGQVIDDVIAAFPYKGTIGIPGVPAPMLIENGWTDALFSAQQGVGLYNQARAASPGADVSLTLADTGHMPASNRTELVRRLVDAGAAFFDAKLLRTGSAPAPSSVKLYPMTCPAPTAAPTPINAASWTAAHPGTLSWSTLVPQTTTSSGLNWFGQLDDDPLIPALGSTVGDVIRGLISGDVDLGDISGGETFGQLFTQALQNSNPLPRRAGRPVAQRDLRDRAAALERGDARRDAESDRRHRPRRARGPARRPPLGRAAGRLEDPRLARRLPRVGQPGRADQLPARRQPVPLRGRAPSAPRAAVDRLAVPAAEQLRQQHARDARRGRPADGGGEPVGATDRRRRARLRRSTAAAVPSGRGAARRGPRRLLRHERADERGGEHRGDDLLVGAGVRQLVGRRHRERDERVDDPARRQLLAQLAARVRRDDPGGQRVVADLRADQPLRQLAIGAQDAEARRQQDDAAAESLQHVGGAAARRDRDLRHRAALLDRPPHRREQQLLAGREVAEERRAADAGALCDLVERQVAQVTRQREDGVEHPLAIALRVRARRTAVRGARHPSDRQ
jgi:hypothetical protein